MYERMLDKSTQPALEEMAAWCESLSEDFTRLNQWLADTFATEQSVVFPYGNKYGWGIAHRKKRKLICNVFPEAGAFTVMLHLSNRQFEGAYAQVGEYARGYVDNKYPCGDGGWIHYRVARPEQAADIETLLTAKFQS